MKKNSLSHSIVALAFLLPFSADAKNNKEIINSLADSLMFPLASMKICGAEFGEPYLSQAEKIDLKLVEVVDTAGFDADAFTKSYNKKIEAINYVDGATFRIAKRENDVEKLNELRRRCKDQYMPAQQEEKSIDQTIKKLSKKSHRSRPSSDTGTSTGSCNHSADFYQERFRLSGKISDLTCFQRAGRRELEAAQAD
jgi:hypothetical protein